MKISERSIAALAKIVTGDTCISPYRSGPRLVRLFNEFGLNDIYGQGFLSHCYYAEEKIRSLNGSASMAELIRGVLDPRDWRDFAKPRDEAIASTGGADTDG